MKKFFFVFLLICFLSLMEMSVYMITSWVGVGWDLGDLVGALESTVQQRCVGKRSCGS